MLIFKIKGEIDNKKVLLPGEKVNPMNIALGQICKKNSYNKSNTQTQLNATDRPCLSTARAEKPDYLLQVCGSKLYTNNG